MFLRARSGWCQLSPIPGEGITSGRTMSQLSSADECFHYLLWRVVVQDNAGRTGLGVVPNKGGQETYVYIRSQDTKARASVKAVTML